MSLILDAGALVGYDKGNRTVRAFLERAMRTGTDVRTTTGAVAQAWRTGSGQARLARLLHGVLQVDLDPAQARRVGVLLGKACAADVIDGSIVDASADGDEILTSDPEDIATLAVASGKTLIITRI